MPADYPIVGRFLLCWRITSEGYDPVGIWCGVPPCDTLTACGDMASFDGSQRVDGSPMALRLLAWGLLAGVVSLVLGRLVSGHRPEDYSGAWLHTATSLLIPALVALSCGVWLPRLSGLVQCILALAATGVSVALMLVPFRGGPGLSKFDWLIGESAILALGLLFTAVCVNSLLGSSGGALRWMAAAIALPLWLVVVSTLAAIGLTPEADQKWPRPAIPAHPAGFVFPPVLAIATVPPRQWTEQRRRQDPVKRERT